MNSKKYSDEEAREILKRAVEYQERDDFSYSEDQLMQLGREMGLSQDAIVKATQDLQSGRETPVRPRTTTTALASTVPEVAVRDVGEEEAAFRRHREAEFRQQLATYLSVIAMLFVINIMTSPSFLWFVFPAMGMVIATVTQYNSLRNTEGDDYEKEFDKWLDKRERRVRKRRRRLERDDDE